MSNVKSIGSQLIEFCKSGENLKAIETLYADDVTSVEAVAGQGERIVSGKDAVIGKNTWWIENHEVHSSEVSGPYPHGDDRFAIRFNYDVTDKKNNQRIKLDEVGVFHVADGKIVREEFFYDM